MFNLSKSTRAPTEGAAPPKEKASPPGIFPPGQRKLVLVVDDNAVTRVLMGTRLRDAGFAAEIAAITPATVERARHYRPDAVVLNLNLHEKAGLELLRNLRKALPDSGVPVFAMSDLHADRLESRAEKLGLSRVFHNTGSRPQEVIKALQDWFAPASRATSPSENTHETEFLKSASAAPASPLDSVDGATTEARIAAVRRELETVALCTRLEHQPHALTALLAAVESLKVNAQSAGKTNLAMMAQALARLVQEFIASHGGLNPARRRMLEQAIGFLQAAGRTASQGRTSAESIAVVVDAQTAQRATMAQVLHEHGFTPRQFGGSSACLPFLERNPAEVVVLHLNLPEGSGYEVAASIRRMPQHAATPLLFVAASNDAEAPSRIALHGPSELIPEPLSTAEFAFKVLMLVSQRRPERPAAKGQRSTRITSPGRALVTAADERVSRTDVSSGNVPILDLESTTKVPVVGDHPDSLLLRRGLLQVDDCWGVRSVNDDGAALLGCPAAALLGRNLREWIILGLPTSPAEAWSTANPFNSESGTAILSLILRRQDSSILPARFRLQKLGDGDDTRWLVMLSPESAPRNESETAIFTKAAFAAGNPESAPAPADDAVGAQSALLRKRIDELLTISTDDAGEIRDAGGVTLSAEPTRPADDLEELRASVAGEDSSVAPSAVNVPAPAASSERNEIPAESPAEVVPEEPATSAIEMVAPVQPDTPSPAANSELSESATPVAAETIAPSTPSNDPGTMKPNPEPTSEEGTSAGAPADINAVLSDDLHEACRQRDEAQQTAADLEARLEASMTALAAATAQVQREQSERRRQEQRAAQLGKRLEDLHEDLKQHLQSEAAAREKSSALEEQFAQRSDTEAQLLADLERETSEKNALREDLDAMASLNQSLHGQIQHLEATAAELGASQQDLEQRLQAGAAALAEAKAGTARVVEERARLENELNQVRVEAEEEARRSSAELARMRASLQVETLHRHRVESEALQTRSRLGEAERAGNASAVRFQQRMRAPVSTLVQSVGRLLDQELSPAQRELAESVLANAALVQTSLQDLGSGLSARRPNAVPTAPAPAANDNPPPARSSGETPVPSDNVKQF